jgi:hypothetical protein
MSIRPVPGQPQAGFPIFFMTMVFSLQDGSKCECCGCS